MENNVEKILVTILFVSLFKLSDRIKMCPHLTKNKNFISRLRHEWQDSMVTLSVDAEGTTQGSSGSWGMEVKGYSREDLEAFVR